MTSLRDLRVQLSQHGFDTLFRGYPDPTFAYDPSGRFIDANQPLIDHNGFIRAELRKMPLAGTALPSESDQASAAFNAAVAGEQRR